jgi:hypothetical protein
MEVAGERKAPGIPPPTLNNPTEILKPLRKKKTENCSAKLKSRANILINEKCL